MSSDVTNYGVPNDPASDPEPRTSTNTPGQDEMVIWDAVQRLVHRIDDLARELDIAHARGYRDGVRAEKERQPDLARELESTRADLYQCKKEREILSHNLSAFTGNA